MYQTVRRIAKQLERQPDWIVSVGSFGIWPDPRCAPKDSDFSSIYLNSNVVPYYTLVCPGRHEDHIWLRSTFRRGHLELLPCIHRLVSGYPRMLPARDTSAISVVGLEKVYSPNVYHGKRVRAGKRLAHYTKSEVERACSAGPIDLMLSEEAGHGCVVGGFTSQAEGINQILYATRARLHIHAHYNHTELYKNPFTGTWCVALARGAAVPIDITNNRVRVLDTIIN